MKDQRPNPEKLLRQAEEEERQKHHGKLKIYLGAAPGVGKTYSMLQDAQSKRAQGLDVVVGVVESHGRKEIENLMQGLEVIPLTTIDYQNKVLKEFDLDAALKRSPALILIDEMAHNNAPGSRHTKRWQDIKELLDRGIDVYTTLNVQHIESLNDVVAQITRIHVRETVPDSMLESADIIELVDLSPDDLLKRLQEGKVYIPEQVELAKQNFFRKGNLASLRELALRVTAERVDAQILNYRQGMGIKYIWPTKERILVCVGSGSKSPKIIRAARRMATRLQAEWLAVYVETPKLSLSKNLHNSAIQNLRLAEQLGAETKILIGNDIVKEIISFARERNVTRIVLGKQIRPRWKDWFFRSLVDELVRYSGEIDIYIIHGTPGTTPLPKWPTSKYKTPYKLYLIAFAVVSIATIFNFFLYSHVGLSNLAMVYLLSVVIVALFGRKGPALFASSLSVIAFDFFFIPHRFSFVPAEIHYLLTLIIMFIIAGVISYLTIISRLQVETANYAESHSSALHILTRQLASTRGIDKLLAIAAQFISERYDAEVMVLLFENNQLTIRARYRSTQLLSAKEQSIAQWVYDLGQPAGLGTDTLSSSEALYLPLIGSEGAIGVLRVRSNESDRFLIPEEMHFLEACANQIALALEVDKLQEQAKISELKNETDVMRNSLLQTISHDVRKPMMAIIKATNALVEVATRLNIEEINKLVSIVYSEAEQINRLINNLLQITYLEAQAVNLQKTKGSIKDPLITALQNLKKELDKRSVNIHFPTDLPLIYFDSVLIQQVFENLLDNAIKFTASNTPIDIYAYVDHNKMIISVEDHGPGITPDEAEKLFEKFYRGRLMMSDKGLGLGLALCYGIIKAHQGDIWAENRKDGGAAFCFSLPLNAQLQ